MYSPSYSITTQYSDRARTKKLTTMHWSSSGNARKRNGYRVWWQGHSAGMTSVQSPWYGT